MLVNTRAILNLSSISKTNVQFAQWNEDDGGLTRLVQIEKDDWHDLGCPYEITVSIEPGDKLNEVTGA